MPKVLESTESSSEIAHVRLLEEDKRRGERVCACLIWKLVDKTGFWCWFEEARRPLWIQAEVTVKI